MINVVRKTVSCAGESAITNQSVSQFEQSMVKARAHISDEPARKRKPCTPEGTKFREKICARGTSWKESVRVPSDCVITPKLLITLIRQLHTTAVEKIVDAAIQELDDRVGDCDLEAEDDCDVDDDLPAIHKAAISQPCTEPRTPTILLPVVKQRI